MYRDITNVSVGIIINQMSLLSTVLQDFWYLFVALIFSGGETYKYGPIEVDIHRIMQMAQPTL
jgi:hypothetical protein